MDQYRPIPRCTCRVVCACLAMRNSKSFRAEDIIIQFLIGLNEEFHGVISQVLLMDPLSQINKVFFHGDAARKEDMWYPILKW